MAKNQSLTAEFEAISIQKTCYLCLTCEHRFKPKGKKQFCSSKCRLLYWALKALLEAVRKGKANGLRGLIKELSEAAKR
jgi:hypothetical protein